MTLIGNATNDPELRHTTSGKAVCSFNIAVDRPGKDAGADYFTVVTWERQAEIVHEYVRKGRQVGIDGRLRYESWEKDGNKRSKVEIVANYVQLLGSKTDTEQPGPQPADVPFG